MSCIPNLKDIFKRGKHKKSRGNNQRDASRGDTPPVNTGDRIQVVSPGAVPSAALSTPGLGPPIQLSALTLLEHGPAEPTGAGHDAWTNLTAFLVLISGIPVLAPIATVSVITAQNEYDALRTQLDELFKDLCVHFSEGTRPTITFSILNLFKAVDIELVKLYDTQDKDTISRYLQANQAEENIIACYRRIQGHLQRLILNTNLNIWKVVDELKTETLLSKIAPSTLTSASYDSGKQGLVRRRECTARTREQVFKDLHAWKNNANGEKICWISGMAGTGKTTITNTLCKSLDSDRELGASFFCARTLPECREVQLIMPTIAYQLARFSYPFRSALSQVLEQDPDIHTKNLNAQFERMVLEPLRAVADALPKKVVVVIDALDECNDNDGVEQILQLLLKHASELPIKFLVSSRPEPHIRERIGASNLITQMTLHTLEKNAVKADIEIYLREELASVSLTEGQLAALIERAGGLFIYAATVVRYIKSGKAQTRLNTILNVSTQGPNSSNSTREIDGLYETVLASALNNQNLEPPEIDRLELVLHTVVCAQEPLTVDALAGLLDLDLADVQEALRPWWSVLHISESDAAHKVSILHVSFHDYMLDSSRSKQFACNDAAHNSKLAESCFRRIGRNIPQFNICDLRSSHVFDNDIPRLEEKVKQIIPLDLLYACRYWAVHLVLGERSKKSVGVLHQLLSERLLLWMEVMNLTKQIDQGPGLIEKTSSDLNVIDTKGLVHDAQRFITTFATNPVARSTPHLYVSMLISWPSDHPISHCYAPRITGLANIKGIKETKRQLALLSMIPVGCAVLCVAFSPNGAFIAAGTSNSTIMIWDSLRCQMKTDPIQGHSAPVQSIAVSPDSTHICSGSEDHTLRIWDSQNGQLIAGPLSVHAAWVRSVDYSPNGLWVASGSNDATVCIWNSESWQLQGSLLQGNGSAVASIAFSPDSGIIATGSDTLIQLWDPPSGKLISDLLPKYPGVIRTVRFFPDGRRLISGSAEGALCMWDVSSGVEIFGPIQLADYPLEIHQVAISPGGSSFALGALDAMPITIWNSQTLEMISCLLGHTSLVSSVAFSPDGSRLVSGSQDQSVRLWDVQGLEEQEVESRSEGHSDWVRSVAFSPCGQFIVSGSDDRTVRIWDIHDAKPISKSLEGHQARVFSVGCSPDGNHFVSGSEDRTIRLWDSQSGALKRTIRVDSEDVLRLLGARWPVAFSPDCNKIISGSDTGCIYMWDTHDGSLLFNLVGHDRAVTSVAFSPDGQLIASSSVFPSLSMWDANSGELLPFSFEGYDSCVWSLAFSPDSSLIASGSDDTTIRLWSTRNGLQLGDSFQGHTDTVSSLAISAHGAHLVSGSQDRTIRVWDIDSRQPIAVYDGHTDIICSVAFSADGRRIVSGSADMTIRLWIAPAPCGASTHRSDHPSKVCASIAEDSSLDNFPIGWTMNEDGWVYDKQECILIWVPPDLHSVLLRPENTLLISRQGRIELEFSKDRTGEEWLTCYQPFAPLSDN